MNVSTSPWPVLTTSATECTNQGTIKLVRASALSYQGTQAARGRSLQLKLPNGERCRKHTGHSPAVNRVARSRPAAGEGPWGPGSGRSSRGRAGRSLTWPAPRRNSTESSCSGTPLPPPSTPIAIARIPPGAQRGLRASENDDFRRPGPLSAEEYGGLESELAAWRTMRSLRVVAS